MLQPQSKGSRYFPTVNQIDTHDKLLSTLRQVLEQHYNLVDQFDEYKRVNPPQQPKGGPPPGSGPADSMLLGLHVAPVDVQTLANGATLKFVKKDGNFQFS